MLIGRKHEDTVGEDSVQLNCTDDISTCDVLDLRSFSNALIKQSSGTAGSHAVYHCESRNGNFTPVFANNSGVYSAVTIDFTSLSGGWTNLEPKVFAGRFFKFLASGSTQLLACRKS